MSQSAEDLPVLFPHPLFMTEDADEEPAEVVWITVKRLGPEGWETFPAPILGVELPNEMAVWERFGGGKYHCIGRNVTHVTGHATFHLEGPKKPLHPMSGPETAAPHAMPSPMGAMAAMGGGEGGAFSFLLQFMMAELGAQRENAARMHAEMQSQTRAHLESMAQLYSSQTQMMASLFQQNHEARDPGEQFLRSIELFQQMQQGMTDGARGGGEESEMDAIEKGVKLFERLERSSDKSAQSQKAREEPAAEVDSSDDEQAD